MNYETTNFKKTKRFFIYSFLFCVFLSCSPKLTISELKHKINKHYTASSEGDIEYFFINHPDKFVKEYGENSLREKLHQMYDNREFPEFYNSIGELNFQERNKCNSTYYYKVKYIVDRTQTTPYLDSTALKRNQEKYGIEHVHFNSNLKILQVRENKESLLLFDKKNKNWIFFEYNTDMKYLDRYFGNNFSNCLKTNVDSSDYLSF